MKDEKKSKVSLINISFNDIFIMDISLNDTSSF